MGETSMETVQDCLIRKYSCTTLLSAMLGTCDESCRVGLGMVHKAPLCLAPQGLPSYAPPRSASNRTNRTAQLGLGGGPRGHACGQDVQYRRPQRDGDTSQRFLPSLQPREAGRGSESPSSRVYGMSIVSWQVKCAPGRIAA